MPSLYGFAYTDAALSYLQDTAPNKIRGQINKRIERLAADPPPVGCKWLVGVSDSEYPICRVRQGNYRILYSIRSIIIVILDIDHRKDVYR